MIAYLLRPRFVVIVLEEKRQTVSGSSLFLSGTGVYHRCCFRRGSNVTEGVSHAGLNSLDDRRKRVNDTATSSFVLSLRT